MNNSINTALAIRFPHLPTALLEGSGGAVILAVLVAVAATLVITNHFTKPRR